MACDFPFPFVVSAGFPPELLPSDLFLAPVLLNSDTTSSLFFVWHSPLLEQTQSQIGLFVFGLYGVQSESTPILLV